MAASGIAPLENAQDIQSRACLPENKGVYTVRRGDTNGQEYTVVANVSEEFAKSVVAYFEQNTHHQGYWISNPDYKPS